jgi:hypothetical protein
MNMEIQYYSKIRWGLAPLAPNDAPPLQSTNLGALRLNIRCYLEVLTGLWESVRKKKPELWPDKWSIHHGIAPEHDALRFCEFLAKESITKMDNPPYSPDLVQCYFRLISKFKNALKEQDFRLFPVVAHVSKFCFHRAIPRIK